MIDVTFLLLIFFLCTLRFQTLEGKLAASLPKDAGVRPTDVVPVEPVEIRIAVTREGRRVLASEPDKGSPWDGATDRRYDFVGRQASYSIGPHSTTDLATLGGWLEDLHRSQPTSPVVLHALHGTTYGEIVPAVDATVEAGFTEIRFGTPPPQGGR